MKKAGKEVEESSEEDFSMEEEEQIPVVENSASSIGVGLVAKPEQKPVTMNPGTNDDFVVNDVMAPTQAMPQPFVAAKTKQTAVVKAPEQVVNDVEEDESIADDFVEESVEDEV